MNTEEQKSMRINRETKILLLSILKTGEISPEQRKELSLLLDREGLEVQIMYSKKCLSCTEKLEADARFEENNKQLKK
ncbi:hypothetical protein EZS27_017057 [termite gut metagenome]|uniref:Uncharacterized protein n=1 Tax=termite gut metagenome TaxID=433724 RepID=A0A5J4RMP8_9ZZZZ